MDLISFIKTIRRVEMLVNCQLSESQKFLEQFQYSNVVNLADSSNDTLNYNENSIFYLNSTEFSSKNKLLEFLKNLKQKNNYFSEKDIKLIEGVFKTPLSCSWDGQLQSTLLHFQNNHSPDENKQYNQSYLTVEEVKWSDYDSNLSKPPSANAMKRNRDHHVNRNDYTLHESHEYLNHKREETKDYSDI